MTRVAREFQIFAKPAGALCNLDCRYCYYLDKRNLYAESGLLRMSEERLENYIVQHIAAATEPTVLFSWHGGEPTVLGLDYFRRIVELERRHAPAGRGIANGIQTNGYLLDEAWARFLAAEQFNVGLSLDGPAELHDAYRRTGGGGATHSQAVRAFDLLRTHGVPTEVVCVVHDRNVERPLSVYRFFRSIGCQSLGFLPVVESSGSGAGGVTPETPSAEAYGTFLCRVFDEWIQHDTARIGVQNFEEASRPGRGLEHSLCTFRPTCGQIPVVEHNLDLYCCDYFVDREHRLGNLAQTPLSELLDSAMLQAFGQAKLDTLPRCCRECEVLALCNGGCPHHRFLRAPNGEPGLNYLCAGLKRFFLHARQPLARLYAPDPVRPVAPPAAGRNEACPCGSGRKYKKCCARA